MSRNATEVRWGVWQTREAGKGIERASVLVEDHVSIRAVVDEWYASNDVAFMDMSDVLGEDLVSLLSGGNSNDDNDDDGEEREQEQEQEDEDEDEREQGNVVEHVVRIIDFVVDEVDDSVHVQDAVISEVVARLKLQDGCDIDGDEEEEVEDDEGCGDRSSGQRVSRGGEEGMMTTQIKTDREDNGRYDDDKAVAVNNVDDNNENDDNLTDVARMRSELAHHLSQHVPQQQHQRDSTTALLL